MTTRARLLIIDDNRVVRHALADLLSTEVAIEVVGTSAMSDDSPLGAIESRRPEVVLLRQAGDRTLELAHAITRRFSGLRVVIVGLKETPEAVTEAIEAGAIGYVPEDASIEEFRETLRLVARGETRLAPRIAATLAVRLAALASTRRAAEQAKKVKLTPRETEILGLVAEGMTNKEGANRQEPHPQHSGTLESSPAQPGRPIRLGSGHAPQAGVTGTRSRRPLPHSASSRQPLSRALPCQSNRPGGASTNAPLGEPTSDGTQRKDDCRQSPWRAFEATSMN
jgi:DNA-binding NarL/FixJ family response regulator